MKAQSLAICIPNHGCNKRCPYCISKLTGDVEENSNLIDRNINKVIKLASTSNVNSVIFTGKGEPLLNMKSVMYFGRHFEDFPIEVQTNGLAFLEHRELVKTLYNHGVNVVSFSFDNVSNFEKFRDVINAVNDIGMMVRVTFNVTDKYKAPEVADNINLKQFINLCKGYDVRQLSFRNITIPHNYNDMHERNKEANKVFKWIVNNTERKFYDSIINQVVAAKGNPIRKLTFDARVLDIDGIAVTYFDYCLQDSHKEEDIRNIIFAEDGHVYTAWNSLASILF
jgi:organic radical activating enzyme